MIFENTDSASEIFVLSENLRILRFKCHTINSFGLCPGEAYPFCMSNHIYKKIELVGSSPDSIEDAVQNAISKASKSLRNLRWFEILETRGQIEEDKIGHWQVTIKVGFTLDG